MTARPLRWVWVAGLLSLVACGARTSLGGASAATDRGDGGAGRSADARLPIIDGRAPPIDAQLADGSRADGRRVDAALGNECRRDTDCRRDRCVADVRIPPADLEPLALACGSLTDGGGEAGARCDEGRACGRGICVVAGTCIVPCVEDGDCVEGQRCTEVFARTSATSLQPVHGCVDRVNLPPDVVVRRDARPGAFTGSGRGDVVELPPTDARALYVLEPSAEVQPTVARLETRGAMSTLLFELAALGPDAPAPRNPVSPFGSPLTVQVPNGPRAVTSTQGYDVLVLTRGPADVGLTVLSRAGRGRLLDLDIFYAGRLRPAGDRGHPLVAQALDRVESLWVDAGLRIGEVRQHEIVGELRRRFEGIEVEVDGNDIDWPELHEMFALSAGAAGPSISLFLVRFVDLALGVSGGLPGPQGMHGTRASGIAIGVESLGGPGVPGDVDLGRAIAHEIGHFLGLYHTSEMQGLVLDPLPDTPECRLDHDANGDGVLLPDECDDAGADNLMYWAASGEDVSGDQRVVVGGAPVLR